METLSHPLTEKEWNWIRCYFFFGGNASKASREVYGGTRASVRVKGWRKVRKFKPILAEIITRELHSMQYQRITGVDLYLFTLNQKAEEMETLLRQAGGTRGLIRLLKKW